MFYFFGESCQSLMFCLFLESCQSLLFCFCFEIMYPADVFLFVVDQSLMFFCVGICSCPKSSTTTCAEIQVETDQAHPFRISRACTRPITWAFQYALLHDHSSSTPHLRSVGPPRIPCSGCAFSSFMRRSHIECCPSSTSDTFRSSLRCTV